ncbi:MAG: single-stranded-DNA-specific exonuclease RecJ [Acidobacteriota bacterium]
MSGAATESSASETASASEGRKQTTRLGLLSRTELDERLARIDSEPCVWSLGDLEAVAPGVRDVAGDLAPILARRGVIDADGARAFLEPSVESLHDPSRLLDMDRAVERILRARADGERVAIVGDYDVDGVSSSALLLAVLGVLGIEARGFLPHRLRDGYGFQVRQVELAEDWGARVIVTVDCGTTSTAAVAAASALGIDVVITDHHLPGEELPQGAILVNPQRPEDDYPFRDLCGAGLAFKLATALLEGAGRKVPVPQLLRIACLGTIADVVPLRGENRVIASLGLRSLAETSSPGLRALFEVSNVSPPLRASDIGFRLGPRLNAAGRLDSPDRALELLLTRDAEVAQRLAAELDALNTERREEESRVVEEATEMFAALDELPGVLFAWSESWHRGVVGIAAGRIARRFRRPTVLLAQSEDDATGSGRSIPGVHLHDFLSQFRELMDRFGGHSAAVGMTVANDRLETLRGVAEAAADWPPDVLARRYEYELSLEPQQFDLDFYRRLQPLAPHGEGNPQPLLRVTPLEVAGAPRIFGNGHLGFAAQDPRTDRARSRVQVVGWNWAARRELFDQPFEILGAAEWDSYLGMPTLRLVDARRLDEGSF